jgi:hypothetical protein
MVSLPFADIAPPEVEVIGSPREWLPQPEAIVDACGELASQGEPEGLVEVLAAMGAPVLDMVVTPLSARAALLAARGGRAFFHHELRGRIPMPPEQVPEVAVWQDEATVPRWQQGVLEEPKYFSFFQDMPFPAFNPNHRRKWRPHELIHGALTFFWHPEMTRFEMYVGSRLNELLPVVHWYGFDEIFRPRCERHQGEVLYRRYCQACEDAARPYWETAAGWRSEQRDEAIGWAERGVEHFAEEWQACMHEIDTGEVCEVARPKLNASSDAVGYMQSHWNRATAWSFGVWVETFLKDGVDYFSSLQRYADHQARLGRQLLSGSVEADADSFETARGRRAVQDVAYRLYLALSWLEPGTARLREAEERLMPHLEQAAHHVHHIEEDEKLAEFSDDVVLDLLGAFERTRGLFPDEIGQAMGALGYTWMEPQRFAVAGASQVSEGLEQAVPLVCERVGEQLDALAVDFGRSEAFGSHGRLASRFARFLADSGRADEQAAELARFEAWAMAPPTRDRDAELFGAIPRNVDELAIRPGRLRLNTTLRRASFAPEVVARATADDGLADASEDIAMARIFMRGELRMVVVDTAEAHILAAVAAGQPRHDWVADVDPDVLANLLENGFIVWLPKPS